MHVKELENVFSCVAHNYIIRYRFKGELKLQCCTPVSVIKPFLTFFQ